MTTTKSSGDKGERIACEYLLSKGYIILERNWRISNLEIDIICSKEDFLIFVEVKYRKDAFFGDPVEFVTEQKMAYLATAASRYIQSIAHEGPIRFDIIGIRPDRENHYKIRHLEDIVY